MEVKQNIGIVNALIRITIGLTLLSWTTAKLSKKPWKQSYLVIAFLAAMKVAEGIIKYCPVTDFVQTQAKNGMDLQNKPPLKQLIDTFTPKQQKENKDNDSSSSHENHQANSQQQ